MNSAAVWALLALVVLALAVGGPALMRRINRAEEDRQAVLDGNRVFIVGEGKDARFALRTPEGHLYEQRSRRGVWHLIVTGREQSVRHLDEEVSA